jgi:polyhydroxybutyrate depolymerase
MLLLDRAMMIGLAVLCVTLGACRQAPPPGARERILVLGDVARTYVLYAGRATKKSALVLVLHGLGGSGVAIEQRTRRTFDTLSDREGFVVVYPNALGGRWHDSWVEPDGPPGEGVDDVAFLSELIDSLSAEYGIDPGRVYATGFSNGAGMVSRLACERENKIAAIAMVSGGMSHLAARRCRTGRAIPILVMHGTKDRIVPYDASVRELLPAWTTRDACPAPPEITYLPDTDPTDGTRVRVDRYGGCNESSEVILYAIEGGGHTWPGGDTWRSTAEAGATSRDFDAAAAIWDFFKRYPSR